VSGLGVRTENLSVRFGGVPALDGLDLWLAPDKIHGLLGRNGSGKSTLAAVMAGFRQPDDGRVQNLWVRVENLLHFARKEFLATAIDDLLAAPRDFNVPLSIDVATQIACAEPTILGESLLVR